MIQVSFTKSFQHNHYYMLPTIGHFVVFKFVCDCQYSSEMSRSKFISGDLITILYNDIISFYQSCISKIELVSTDVSFS